MILATSASPSPVPDGLVVTNGSNRCGIKSADTPRAIVRDRDFERQADAGLAPRHGQTHARPERGGERDLAVRAVVADRLGRVLHEIEERLDQLVAVARHRRQRRIVVLDDLDSASEAGDGDLLDVIEHVVNVDRFALRSAARRRRSAMRSTSLQMRSDSGADELGQGAVGIGALAFEQLRRAADAGERILDLVGEHGGKTRNGTRRARGGSAGARSSAPCCAAGA